MLKRSKKKKLKLKFKQLKSFSLLLAVAVLAAAAWWLLGANYQSGHPVLGQQPTAPLSDPNAYKNLDLRLASTANYKAGAIKTIKELDVAGTTKVNIVSFEVDKDHLTENALMTLPTSPPPSGGYPVIILCHGYAYPWSYSTYQAYLGDMDFYTQHGFAVIKPDFRGQGTSLPSGTAEGAYYSMAYNTDTMSLIAAVKQTSYLNKNAINIWGHSMGAYIALRATVLSPDIKSAILLSGPVGSLADMYSMYVAISDSTNPAASAIRDAQLTSHGSPVSNPDYWDNASPINFLNKTNAKIQIHVGTDDKIVPPQLSADLDAALTKAGKAHNYYVYSGAPHSLLNQRADIWSRSLQVLKR